jgi:hypothetical protein
MNSSDFPLMEDGEWVRPVKNNFGFACCDCGLVHRIDFRHIKWGRGRKVIFRARRDSKSTKELRKRMEKEKGKEL